MLRRQRERIADSLSAWESDPAVRMDMAETIIEDLKLSVACAGGCRLTMSDTRKAILGLTDPPRALYCIQCGMPHDPNGPCGRDDC